MDFTRLYAEVQTGASVLPCFSHIARQRDCSNFISLELTNEIHVRFVAGSFWAAKPWATLLAPEYAVSNGQPGLLDMSEGGTASR